MMKFNLKNILTFLVGWPLSFLALFFIIKTFLPNTDQIKDQLGSLNIWLLLVGGVCFFAYYVLRSIIWHEITNEQGYNLSLRKSAFLWASSEIKRYIPGNIWSFLGRTILFSEQGMKKKDVAKGLIIEMQLVMFGCIFTMLLSLPFLAKHFFPFLQDIPHLKGLAIILAAGIALAYMHVDKLARRFPAVFQKFQTFLLPDFSPGKRLLLMFLSTVSFVLLGLGYYFSISAITLLPPQQVFVLTGFFVFTLLIGLLSFITPTGLGVREGAITYGLSQIIPLGLAGFASIFGRILLVIAEVVFLLMIYLISSIKNKFIVNTLRFVNTHRYEVVLGLMIAIFIIYFSLVSVLRHNNFYTGRFDLGNMDQTVWNTIHGRIFQFTNPDGTETVSRLAFHADFILVLLAPLYLLWADPRMLLLVQTIVVGLGAIFVYLLAKDLVKHKSIALSLAFVYLLNPSIQRATIYDFHAVTLATTFLLGAFYFIHKRRYGWFLVFAILAGITKEQIWFIVALMGLYIMSVELFKNIVILRSQPKNLWSIRRSFAIAQDDKKPIVFKNILFGLSVLFVSCFMFYFLIWRAIPGAANTSGHFALSYFSDETEGPSDLIKNTFLSPFETWDKVSSKERKTYYKQLLLPVGYLPLGAPWVFIFPAADLALNVLSDKAELHQIYYQYTAAISPFLFIGAVYAIFYLLKLFPQLPAGTLTVYVLAMGIYGAYLYSPLPGTKEPNLAMLIKQNKDVSYIKDALASIDPHYSVAASNNLGAHLTHRERIYTIPRGVDEADVLVFHLGGSWNQPSNEWHIEKVEELRNDPRFAVWFEKDGFVVFKRL